MNTYRVSDLVSAGGAVPIEAVDLPDGAVARVMHDDSGAPLTLPISGLPSGAMEVVIVARSSTNEAAAEQVEVTLVHQDATRQTKSIRLGADFASHRLSYKRAAAPVRMEMKPSGAGTMYVLRSVSVGR
jgi:hypothetical protein